MIAMAVNGKTGGIVGMKSIDDNDDIIMMNSNGIMIRTALSQLARLGRGARGVTLMRLGEDEKVVSVAIVPHDDEVEEDSLPEQTPEPELDEKELETAEAADNASDESENTDTDGDVE